MSGGKATNITFNCNNATVGGAVYNAEVSFDSRFKNNLPNDTFNATFFEKEYLKTFSDLNALINGKDDEVVYLNDDYTFDIAYDFEFMSGININRNVTVIGNANTIDANYNARVFMVLDGNVTFSNIRFVNAKSGDGSVINGKSTSINCTFINNSAENYYGGVMYNGYAIYCTFINNRAYYGGAMYYGSAVNCTFINNSADRCGGAIHYGSSAVNCTFINNSADYGGAIY